MNGGGGSTPGGFGHDADGSHASGRSRTPDEPAVGAASPHPDEFVKVNAVALRAADKEAGDRVTVTLARSAGGDDV